MATVFYSLNRQVPQTGYAEHTQGDEQQATDNSDPRLEAPYKRRGGNHGDQISGEIAGTDKTYLLVVQSEAGTHCWKQHTVCETG